MQPLILNDVKERIEENDQTPGENWKSQSETIVSKALGTWHEEWHQKSLNGKNKQLEEDLQTKEDYARILHIVILHAIIAINCLKEIVIKNLHVQVVAHSIAVQVCLLPEEKIKRSH